MQNEQLNKNVFSQAGILIVDDAPDVVAMLSMLCFEAGFAHVFTASNGFDALRILERHSEKIDLLSLDMRMPGMDGLRLAETVANTHSRIVGIVMVTGFGSAELKKDFLAIQSNTALAEDFLVKPFEVDQLLVSYGDAIRDVFAKRERQVENEITSMTKELKRGVAFCASTLAGMENELNKVDEKASTLQLSVNQMAEQIKSLTEHAAKKNAGDISYVLGLTFIVVFVITALAFASVYLPVLSVIALASVAIVVLMLIAVFDLSKGNKLSERSLMEVLRRAFKFVSKRGK